MILDAKQTTVAYRCPHCGSGVLSAVGMFSLSADMMKLKCTCGKSEMTVLYGKDGKLRLTVPCMVCTQPHHFSVSSGVFFNRDLFVLPCPYSDLNIAMTGDVNLVKAELARSELELLDLMEKSGVKNFDQIHEAEEKILPDEQVLDVVMFVIHDLDAEGKIFCRCPHDDPDREYDVEILEDSVRVSCKKCGASRTIPTDSGLAAYAFLNSDELHLE